MTDRTWADYLAGQSLEGFLDFLAFHAPLLHAIIERRPKRTIEVGCGGANLSIFLSLLGVSAVGLDLERDVLKEAARHSGALSGKTELVRSDGSCAGFRDGAFDVAFSQGVLEHFDDRQIAGFLRESMRIARCTIASVPNANYPARDFGNERLMPAEFWRERAEQVVARAGVHAKVTVSDYRRRFDRKHPLRSAVNTLMKRCVFTLIVIELIQ